MTWKRYRETSTKFTRWESVGDRYVIYLYPNGEYKCLHGYGPIGSAGLLGGAKNLCEMHAKGGK